MGKKALVVVDMQIDFCPGGALGVPGGDLAIPYLNRYIEKFEKAHLPIYFSRDWHPQKTIHFRAYGGVWPPHCVQDTPGARFHPDLKMPGGSEIVSKGMDPEQDAYSVFHGTDTHGHDFDEALREQGVDHLYIGGLTTDYCVRSTSLDALERGFKVTILTDAIAGVDLNPGDSARALEEARAAGAETATIDSVDTADC